MRIGINLLYLIPGRVGGTEIYAKGLLHGLAQEGSGHEFVIFLNQSASSWPLPKKKNFRRVVCPISGVSQTKRYFYEQLRLPFKLRKEKIDLVHSLGYVGPLFSKLSSVVTVHDLNFIYLRKVMPIQKIITRAFFVGLSVHCSNHVITVSNFSKREIAKYLLIPPQKISVTYESVFIRSSSSIHWKKIRDKYNLNSPYILAFSSLSRHKNIDGLLYAYSLIKDEFPHNLVIIGHVSSKIDLTRLKKKLKLNERVITPGYLPDEVIQPILKHSSLFVFPSFYEGFGLPLLEAQAAGVPVVSSRAGSLPEVGGDGAIYFDPYSVTEMARAIRRCLSDFLLKDRLTKLGKKNIQRFSWRDTARKTMEVYNRILV